MFSAPHCSHTDSYSTASWDILMNEWFHFLSIFTDSIIQGIIYDVYSWSRCLSQSQTHILSLEIKQVCRAACFHLSNIEESEKRL